jgi:hypothetical protein
MPDEEIDRRVFEHVNGGGARRAGSLAEELAALRAEIRDLKAAVMAPREPQLIRDDAGRPQRAISVSLYNGELPAVAVINDSELCNAPGRRQADERPAYTIGRQPRGFHSEAGRTHRMMSPTRDRISASSAPML